MKDFAKSIRTNNANVGNFEDPKKAEYYIKMWQHRKDEAERALRNAELNIKELHRRKSPFGFDSMHAKEVKANEEAKKAAEADIKKYSDLIKTAAKTTWGNGKVGNKFIPVKKKDGYYMPVEEGFYYKINGKRVGVEKINGKSLKLTDGTTISVDQIQDIDVSNSKPKVGNYYEVGTHITIEQNGKEYDVKVLKDMATKVLVKGPNGAVIEVNKTDIVKDGYKTGNSKVGNAKDKNGIELKIGDVVAVKTDDPKLNHGRIKRISGDQVSVDVTGDDDIWTTPARLVVKMGNSKVGNREISLSASNSGELNLYDDGTGFMYDPIELGRYDIEGKSDAMATVRELEKLKRNAETKIKDCQKFIDTLKQWANGLK